MTPGKAINKIEKCFRRALRSNPVFFAIAFQFLSSARFQNMDSGTKLTAKDATDAKTPAFDLSTI